MADGYETTAVTRGDVTAPPRGRRRFSVRSPELRSFLLVGDALAAGAASWAAPEVWAVLDPRYVPLPLVPYWQVGAVVAWLVALRLLPDQPSSPHVRPHIMSVLQATIGVALLVLVLFYLFPFFAPRGSTFLSVGLIAGALLAWRILFASLLRTDMFEVRVALVGVDEAACRTAQVLTSQKTPYKLQAFLVPDARMQQIQDVPVVSVRGDIWPVVQALGIEQLVIGQTRNLSIEMLNDLVRCFDHGIEAIPATALYEEVSGRVLASALEADWYAELPTHTRGGYVFLKRLVDTVLGAVLLCISLPVIALLGVAVYADTGSPIMFRQIRIGRRGRPFVIHKLRTMSRDAEPLGAPVWARANDARITRVGRLLRRSRLDELPEFWDVVRGEMSLIGPRPERPEFAEALASELPLYRARSLVRPGITGWAQIEYSYAGSVADNLTKLEYDLYYLRRMSPLLDLKIALRTVSIIFGLRGR